MISLCRVADQGEKWMLVFGGMRLCRSFRQQPRSLGGKKTLAKMQAQLCSTLNLFSNTPYLADRADTTEYLLEQ